MPSFFSRKKDKVPKAKKNAPAHPDEQKPLQQRWEDAWTRKDVAPEEVQELLRGCTVELKSRGLDIPFLLLPFRPTSDPSAARTFVRNFFNSPFDRGEQLQGHALAQELRLTDPMVLCSVLKWCWSRLSGGVVTWEAYELFRQGENDSNQARDAFATFIPLSIDSPARTKIVFDFFDLLSAIAAHGKTNGLGGRKVSRLAGWWAFEHQDTGSGFDGGYKHWTLAADATSHLFFAYLRSLSPDSVKGISGISTLPSSLQRLVQETEYPPERSSLLQTRTTKVVMIVDSVSPTPFSLLRRTNHFQYRDEDRALQEFSDYDEPSKALTDECRRVLNAISSTNQSQSSDSKQSTGLRDASWSRFEDMGFSSNIEDIEEDQFDTDFEPRRRPQGLRTTPQSKTANMGRPTTPSWADFLNVGFIDEKRNGPAPLLLPPDKILPPINTSSRGRSSHSHHPRLESERQLEPGELASITRFDLDDAFWWVWISSLAGEEPAERKASFGRCAVVETVIRGGKWLVMEEMVKGAAPEPEAGAYIAEKKSIFSWGRKSKGLARSKSAGKQPSKQPPNFKAPQSQGPSKVSIGPDQHARIQAAAAQLSLRQRKQEHLQNQSLASPGRRGREMDNASARTASVFTLQPVIMKEASPAMKWANKYDKDAIKEAYLANNAAGKGLGQATIHRQDDSNGYSAAASARNSFDQEATAKAERQLPTPPGEVEVAPAVPSKGSASAPPAPLPPTPGLRNGHDTRAVEQATEIALPGDVDSPAVQSPIQHTSIEQERMMSPDRRDLRSPTPDQKAKQHNKLKKEKREGGFRKLFSRRRKTQDRTETPTPIAESSLQPGGATMGRRFSGFHQSEQNPIISPDHDQNMDYPPAGNQLDQGETTPVQPRHSYDRSVRESLSRVDTDDAHEARREFSNFDQGPLEDQPAFVPIDSPIDSPIDGSVHDDGLGEDLSKEPSPVQDRWARIRKNAAELAAQRQSEEQSRGGQSTITGDDGESDHETIESRVARIKARVAELTSTTDSPPPPQSPPARARA